MADESDKSNYSAPEGKNTDYSHHIEFQAGARSDNSGQDSNDDTVPGNPSLRQRYVGASIAKRKKEYQ